MPKSIRRAPLAAALALALAPFAAHAATVAVTSPNDTSASGSQTCTLRQAIVSLNTGSVVGACAASAGTIGDNVNDTIVFAASAGSTIALGTSDATSSALVVTDRALTIDASAIAGGITITPSTTATRYFSVLYDTAAAGSSLKLVGLTISKGFSVSGCDIYGQREGGGICVLGANVTLDNCVVTGNTAAFGGGIFAKLGNITLTNSTVSNNYATATGGGVGAAMGNVYVNGSTVSGNTAADPSHANNDAGGGIYSAEGAIVALADSTISGNSAKKSGGGIFANGANVTLSHSVVTGNRATYTGGGIQSHYNLTIGYSTISDNYAFQGPGGGIAAGGPKVVVAIANSTINGNWAGGSGGGIDAHGSQLTLTDTTVAHNQSSHYGSAIESYVATLTLNNTTIALNAPTIAPFKGALVVRGGPVAFTMNNTLFWNNTSNIAAGVLPSGSALAVHGDGNLVDNNGTGWTQLAFDHTPLTGNPDLADLSDNGGPTLTMALGPNSIAIDAGNASLVPGIAYDQRGAPYARVSGAAQDIGAYEWQFDEIFANGFE